MEKDEAMEMMKKKYSDQAIELKNEIRLLRNMKFRCKIGLHKYKYVSSDLTGAGEGISRTSIDKCELCGKYRRRYISPIR